MWRKQIRFNSGFSLIETLVAASLLVILIMGTTSLFDLSGKSQKTLDAKSEVLRNWNAVMLNMSFSNTCLDAMKDSTGRIPYFVPPAGGSPTDHALYELRSGQTPYFRVRTETFGYQTTQITFENTTAASSASGEETYLTDLKLTGTHIAKIFGNSEIDLRQRMAVTIDVDPLNSIPNNQMIRCRIVANEVNKEIINTTVVNLPSVYVEDEMGYYNTEAWCADGYAMVGLWDDNDEFQDYDAFKCRKFTEGLKHRNIYRFEDINPLDGPATPAAPPALWRVECPGDSVIVGFDGDRGSYDDLDKVFCAELWRDTQKLTVNKNDCYIVSTLNKDGGPHNSVVQWNIEPNPNYALVGIWDASDNFSDLDRVKYCRYTAPASP